MAKEIEFSNEKAVALLLGWMVMAMGVLLAAQGAEGNGRLVVERAVVGTATALAVEAEKSLLSPIFTASVQRWGPDIKRWADEFQLDPNLVATVMQIESCGLASAVSRSGAQGLFQVMPWHFAAEDDMLDPDTNATRGLAYLALGLERAGGNVGLALAGYNGGHGQIGRDPSLWPAETKRYYYWGTGIYEGDKSRLEEWLAAGGQGLCDSAEEELEIK